VRGVLFRLPEDRGKSTRESWSSRSRGLSPEERCPLKRGKLAASVPLAAHRPTASAACPGLTLSQLVTAERTTTALRPIAPDLMITIPDARRLLGARFPKNPTGMLAAGSALRLGSAGHAHSDDWVPPSHRCRFDWVCGRSTKRGNSLPIAVGDPAAGEVIRRKLNDDPVAGEHANIVLAHLTGQMGENGVAVF